METQIKDDEVSRLCFYIQNISLTQQDNDEVEYFDEFGFPVYKKDLEKKSSIKRLENFLKR